MAIYIRVSQHGDILYNRSFQYGATMKEEIKDGNR
jgi:hypothetical protein